MKNFTTGFTAAGLLCWSLSAEAGWRELDSGTAETLSHIHCLSAQRCWCVSTVGTVLQTTDGGESWDALGGSVDPVFGLNAVHFVSGSTGWASGLKTIARTLNGGSSWTTYQHPNVEDQPPLLNGVFALSPSVAYVAGALPSQLTLWRYRFAPNGDLFEDVLAINRPDIFMDVSFATSDRGWGVGSRGVIFRIDDPEAVHPERPALTFQVSGVTSDLNAVSVLPSGVGFVVGDGGVVLRTHDHGDQWAAALSDTSQDLQDVDIVNQDVAWAVGANGTTLRTVDGGDSFVLEPIPATGAFLTTVDFIEDNLGYAVGSDGVILKWEDQTCGNAILEEGEQCDLGAANGTAESCCSALCEYKGSTEICRVAGGSCDQAEHCPGDSAACPENLPRASGAPCGDNPCLEGQTCQGFVCSEGEPKVCAPPNACHAAGVCRGTDGMCIDLPLDDGTPCSGGSCYDGVCRMTRDAGPEIDGSGFDSGLERDATPGNDDSPDGGTDPPAVSSPDSGFEAPPSSRPREDSGVGQHPPEQRGLNESGCSCRVVTGGTGPFPSPLTMASLVVLWAWRRRWLRALSRPRAP